MLPKGWQRESGPIKKKYPAKGKYSLFTCVRDEGPGIGKIEEVAAYDAAAEAAKLKAAAKRGAPQESTDEGYAPGDDSDATASLDAATDTAPDVPEPALTKKGQTLLAAMKTDALRDSLDSATDGSVATALQLPSLASALVLALSADNVSISGGSGPWSATNFRDLRSQIVSPGGTFFDLDESQVCRMVAAALSRILRVTDPANGKGSGEVAEWIGAMLGAEHHLPCFDTPEFLGCMGKDALLSLAAEQGRGGLKTAKGIREALAGSLPDWRPATFGAPGPELWDKADMINQDQEEAA
jgi:hypothetical protein